MIWYRVQIGAYAIKKSAEKVSVDLIEKGFKTTIAKEGLLYKVRVGSFQDKAKAEKLLARVHGYKKYEKAKILEWNDGKDLPIIDISGDDDKKEDDYRPLIKFVAIWHTESCEDKFGDAQVFIEYAKNGVDIAHAILVDTGMNGSDTIKKLKKLGIKTLDAVVISHAHGDHYGYLDEMFKQFKINHLYLPGIAGLQKYQPSYAKALQNKENKAKKLNIPVTYLNGNSEFTIGHINCWVAYQVPAQRLGEKDNHHFVNNQSILTLFTLDGVGRVMLTGDLSNPANKVIMDVWKNMKDSLQTDIAKCGWHGDGNAMTIDWAKFIGAICWYWNYHHKESKGGRGNTREKLEKAGVKKDNILRNFEDGDLFFTYQEGRWVVETSKSKKSFSFKSRFAK